MARRISPAQVKFMKFTSAWGEAGWRCPFTGGRDAGRVASAWHRTAKSLVDAGYVRLERSGDSWRAYLTVVGDAVLSTVRSCSSTAAELFPGVATDNGVKPVCPFTSPSDEEK